MANRVAESGGCFFRGHGHDGQSMDIGMHHVIQAIIHEAMTGDSGFTIEYIAYDMKAKMPAATGSPNVAHMLVRLVFETAFQG